MQDLSDVYAQEKSAWLYILDLLAQGETVEAERLIALTVRRGIYRHFKSSLEAGEKLYLVSGYSSDVDSKEYRVDYRSYYGEKRGTPAHRPLLAWQNGFLVPVKRASYAGPRFILMRPLSPHEYANELQKLEWRP
ncbi:MAG TPA: hypothetical protein VHO23_03100 [Candidatus Paceibacterota bacterium]|nr:hypothetical protein [Candidatus Paceibacterota bacterium]